MPQVSLKNLESEVTTTQGYQVATYIRNNKGQYVGKFVTSGVGLNEHKRRFNSVVKKTVKEKK
jgi:hypothetical protein